jgi:hypothetical protein
MQLRKNGAFIFQHLMAQAADPERSYRQWNDLSAILLHDKELLPE